MEKGKNIFIVIGCLCAFVLEGWSVKCWSAGVNEKVYRQYQQEIWSVIEEDPNSPKKMQKAVGSITRGGDAEQQIWLSTTLSRVDGENIREEAIPVYMGWCQALIEKLVAGEPDLAVLANGRKARYLYDPFFYPQLAENGKLAEMFSLLMEICDMRRYKQQAVGNPGYKPMYEEVLRVKSHYVESRLYGEDRYSSRVYGEAMDEASLQRLIAVAGNDLFLKEPILLLASFAQMTEEQQTGLLAIAEEIYIYGEHYLSPMEMDLMMAILGRAAKNSRRKAEETQARIAVMKRLYPTAQKMNTGLISSIQAEEAQRDTFATDFPAYRKELQARGKAFADYIPPLCPAELQTDPEFIQYLEMYVRTGYTLCKKISKMNAENYINSSGMSLRLILEELGYNDKTIHWVDRFAQYMSHLSTATIYLYHYNQAPWTIGAVLAEAKILTEITGISSTEDIYYSLAQMVPFFSAQIGDDAYAREIMDTFLLPYLPKANLTTKDHEQNCYYMDIYSVIIRALRLYDEPRRSELAEFYIPRFEEGIRVNTDCPMRYNYLSTIAGYYIQQEDSTKALQYAREQLALTQDTGAYYLNEYFIYSGIASDYVRAAAALDQVNSTDSAMASYFIEYPGLFPAYVYAKAGEPAKAIQQLNVFNTFIRQEFAVQLMSIGGEQASELLKRYEDVDDFFIQSGDEMETEAMKAGFTGGFYNWQLFSKGLLLALSRESEAILKQHPDAAIRSLYEQLQQLETRMTGMKDPESFEAQMLQSDIDKVRSSLMYSIRDYITQSSSVNIHLTTWQDVRDALGEGEVAIEIACGKETEDSIETYYALLLRHGDRAPSAIRLFREPELTPYLGAQEANAIHATYAYGQNGKRLAKIIWGNILPYLHAGERVYFSPTSALHQIAIENLPYDAGRTMSDVYDMVRLSSTREIARQKTMIPHKKATLYGGILYNARPDDLSAESARYPDIAARTRESDAVDRGQAKYLPGTKTEIEQIGKMLEEQKIQVASYTSLSANEESFKALSGTGQNILHLATHGFYWPRTGLAEMKEFDQYSVQYLNDPLNRCGLLFAGANIALSGHADYLEPGVQDGILTAKEISLLDFSQADIVVLSACETGLGDVTSEGVFGLQRAFKMAGAQTLLMALWRVSDDATRLLMTYFYRHMREGMSKREAFRKAQQEVRNYTSNGSSQDEKRSAMQDKFMQHRPGSTQQAASDVSEKPSAESAQQAKDEHPYASPYYWAGFVLLD